MIQRLFGEISYGTMGRLGYLGYGILIPILGVLASLIFSVTLGAGTFLVDDLSKMDINLTVIIMMVPVVVFALMLGFATMNITAKRIRHTGLPGWTTLLFLTAMIFVFSILNFITDIFLFNMLIWPIQLYYFLLLLIPGQD